MMQPVTDEQSELIRRFVRRVAECVLTDQTLPLDPAPLSDITYQGLFVTLTREGRLRGCVGTFAPSGALWTDLMETTRSSLQDARFVHQPITASELASLSIEVSILSQMRNVDDPLSLEAGRHGIVINSPRGSGCFLPQVATEHGLNMLGFLRACCVHKAGLPANAWRETDTIVRSFEVTIISERRPGPIARCPS